ncbi:MAG: heparinase II/III family protein [Planctomycetota bacterium]|nr:heparinase II/III family protein [Planctomycetota bacterium]
MPARKGWMSGTAAGLAVGLCCACAFAQEERGMEKLWGLDVGKLRARARAAEWAETVATFRSQVEELKRNGIRIPRPDEPAGWWHDYVCPKCASRLTFDRKSAREHRCPACGGVFRSEAMNRAWVSQLNSLQISEAFAACVIAALQDDRGAADLAKGVLLGYARRYPDYPERPFQGGWSIGRLQGTGLEEATWMISASKVFRFLRDNGLLTGAEAEEVLNKMFVPSAALLKKQVPSVGIPHNIALWLSAATFSMADLAGRAGEVEAAERTIRANLEKGILPDGSWFEGSPHYHFYTLDALMEYVLAARAAGRPLVLPDRIRLMFESPLQMLLPDRTLPLLNDGHGSHPLVSRARNYEMAWYFLGGVEGVLSTIYRECGAKRTAVQAFLYGPDEIPDAEFHLKSLAVVDGVAVARRKGMVGLVKATPFGGGHDHPDKPGLYLFRENSALKAADIGTPSYGSPMHREFYRTTAAHNTMMVDGNDQKLAPAKIALAREYPEYAAVQAVADQAYDGVTIRRTAVFGDGWALDWTACSSAREHDYTWLFHANGPLDVRGEGQKTDPAPEPVVKNKHVSGQRLVKSDGGEVRGFWSERGGGPNRLHFQVWPVPPVAPEVAGAGGNRFVAVAESPDLPPTLKRGVLVAGGRDRRLDVVAFFCWGDAAGRPVCAARVLGVGPKRLKVGIERAGGTKPLTLEIADTGDVVTIEGAEPAGRGRGER